LGLMFVVVILSEADKELAGAVTDVEDKVTTPSPGATVGDMAATIAAMSVTGAAAGSGVAVVMLDPDAILSSLLSRDASIASTIEPPTSLEVASPSICTTGCACFPDTRASALTAAAAAADILRPVEPPVVAAEWDWARARPA